MSTHTEYMGYSLFKDVVDNNLRAWNRIVTYQNIEDYLDKGTAKTYLSYFKGTELTAIMMMVQYMKQKGVEHVKREMLKATQ